MIKYKFYRDYNSCEVRKIEENYLFWKYPHIFEFLIIPSWILSAILIFRLGIDNNILDISLTVIIAIILGIFFGQKWKEGNSSQLLIIESIDDGYIKIDNNTYEIVTIRFKDNDGIILEIGQDNISQKLLDGSVDNLTRKKVKMWLEGIGCVIEE